MTGSHGTDGYRTDVGRFVIARKDEELAGDQGGTQAYALGFTERETAVYLDSIENLLGLGEMAAAYAWHPDYENWPAPDGTTYLNSPPNAGHVNQIL